MNETESQSQPFKLNLLSEGLLLAWVPVAIYFLTFCYERSYCKLFGIPLSLAEVGPEQMINFLFSLYPIWVFLIIIVGVIYEHRFVPQRISRAQWSYSLLGLVALVLLQINGAGVISLAAVGYVVLILLLFLFDLFMARHSEDKSLQGLYVLLPMNVRNGGRLSPPEDLLCKLAGLTFLGFILSSSLGENEAKTQKEFSVLQSNPSLILLGVKDNKAVCASYDSSTKKVTRGVVILPLSEKEQTVFEVKEIGPLVFPEQE